MTSDEEIEKAKAQLDWIERGNGKKYEDPDIMREKVARLRATISEGNRIDRSKPLPIHEGRNLIDAVARLRGLEAKAASPPWRVEPIETARGSFTARVVADHNRPTNELLQTETDLLTELRNAAPMLLDVLCMIRAGDMQILSKILEFIVSESTESDWADAIEVLHRYRDMAERMEAR